MLTEAVNIEHSIERSSAFVVIVVSRNTCPRV